MNSERRVAGVLRICFQREGLNPTDRAILRLRLFGFQFAEIAEELGVSKQTAMTRFTRLKPRLRVLLKMHQVDWGQLSPG